jgi:hypothetical protein
MDFIVIAQMLVAKFPITGMILSILGGLVIMGQVIVAMTPSKSDDEKWEAIKAKPVIGPILSALANFAPIQKK